MRNLILLGLLTSVSLASPAQELYVSSEPASNMPARSIGARLAVEAMPGGAHRDVAESMLGINKNLMFHVAAFRSDVRTKNDLVFEGWSLYGKYRFFSADTVHRHFRAAFYGRASSSKAPILFNEVNLEGDNSGLGGGLILTQLAHKLAVSFTGGYLQALDNGSAHRLVGPFGKQVNYSLSAGYLLFPKEYTGYKQVNINLYAELLGKSALQYRANYLEIAPAVQFIFGSRLRFDVSKRVQLYGNMARSSKNMLLIRAEYSIFNVF